LILAAILLLAVGLRVYRLDAFSLRGDESFTVLFVQNPQAQKWHETLTVEPNPPLLYFLLRGWIVLAGAGEFATRFFSVWFGVLCVPLIYRLAREIFAPGRGATPLALAAALLVAVNPYQIWHSQDVRNYTMWPALSLLGLVLFWKWYRRSQDRERGPRAGAAARPDGLWLLGGFVVVELASLYTHYYEAFLLLGLNLFVLLTMWRERRRLIQWVGAQVVLAVLYLPYPLVLSNRVSAYGEGSGRQGVALWDVVRETFSAFVVGETWDATWRAWVWVPFALLALGSLVHLCLRDAKRGLFFLLYAGIPLLAVYALNVFRPLYLERYLNAIAPVYYLLLAYGIVMVAGFVSAWIAHRPRTADGRPSTEDGSRTTAVQRWASILIVLAVSVLAVVAAAALNNYWTNPAFAKSPAWRELSNLINDQAQPGDIIVQNFPETSLIYYDRSKLPLVVYPETFLPDAETTRALNALNANYQRVWFIPAAEDAWDPDQFVESWLDHRDDLQNEWEAGDFRLRLYATPSLYLNSKQHTDAMFGDFLGLLGYRLERNAERLKTVLYWRTRGSPDGSYEVRLELFDAAGKLLHEQSGIPVRGSYPTTIWRRNETVVDQHDLPMMPGAVSIRVQVCEIERRACLPLDGAQSDGLTIPLEP
jgi:4-amino-4-deoxy-L-arabinose transferase-like glycosyltransferase